MKFIEKDCKNCQKRFSAPKIEHNRGRAIFCSISCSTKFNAIERYRLQTTPNCKCYTCGKDFYRNTSKKKNSKSGFLFCGRTCKEKAQRIEGLKAIHPPHYENGIGSYREKAFADNPHVCADCGYNKYVDVLEVHHIDGKRWNNDTKNLVILCPTCHNTRHYLNRLALYS